MVAPLSSKTRDFPSQFYNWFGFYIKYIRTPKLKAKHYILLGLLKKNFACWAVPIIFFKGKPKINKGGGDAA